MSPSEKETVMTRRQLQALLNNATSDEEKREAHRVIAAQGCQVVWGHVSNILSVARTTR